MTDDNNIVPLALRAAIAPTKNARRGRRRGQYCPIKGVSDKVVFNEKLSRAYLELEPVILDLERAAKIAKKLFYNHSKEEIELARFAVEHFSAMASDLARLWNKKYDAARAEDAATAE